MEFRLVVLMLSLCMTQISSVFGCTCMWGTHNQQHFCQADFAIKAEVKNVSSDETDFGYVLYHYFTMKVYKVYKEHPNVTIGQEVVIKTGGNGAMCGVYLSKNVTYFIAGYVYGNALKMNSCGWLDSFDSLTKSQVHGIEHDYKENCECAKEIETRMMILPSRDSCSYGPDKPFEMSCYYNNAYCAKKGPNKCRWVVDSKAEACQKRRKLPKLLRNKNKYD